MGRIVKMDSELIDNVASVVAEINGLDTWELKTKSRKRYITLPRQLSMYICREKYSELITFKHLGEFFGNRDHSSVINSCQAIGDLLSTNDRIVKQMYSEAIYRLSIRETSIDTLIDPHSHSALNLAAV